MGGALPREKPPLWKLQPLLYAPGLWHRNSFEYAKYPFKHTTTDNLIGVMEKALKDISSEHRDCSAGQSGGKLVKQHMLILLVQSSCAWLQDFEVAECHVCETDITSSEGELCQMCSYSCHKRCMGGALRALHGNTQTHWPGPVCNACAALEVNSMGALPVLCAISLSYVCPTNRASSRAGQAAC